MEDEAILLKIKRDFTTNEAVQSLLKIISALEFEIGELKSEKDELRYKLDKATNEGVKGKKLWLKEDVISEMDRNMKRLQQRNSELTKQLNEYRNSYFSIKAQYRI